MAQALETAAAQTSELYFELDRFELGQAQRLELRGRWFGVRGRRFVRPTLTLLADEQPRRVLADLEHKPWAAEDGEDWVAAFPWDLDGEQIAALELSVAPDIVVELPQPGSGPARVDAFAHRNAKLPPEASVPEREFAHAVDQLERLRGELDEARSAQVQANAALARRDSALSRVQELTARLEQTEQERDRAVSERDRAVSERDRAVSERDRVVRARDQAIAKCERLIAEKAELHVSLEEALAAARHAEQERLAARRERDHVQASAVARSALRADPPVHRRHLRWQPRAAGSPYSQPAWPIRLLALSFLLVALGAFVLITRIV
jgi:hypothetical protein